MPSGRFLVHNHIKPAELARKTLALEGSGCGCNQADDEDVVLCDCGWAPELGKHYITVRSLRGALDLDSATGL